MKKKQASKTKRLALFSETDRDYLQGTYSKSIVSKSQFHHNLDERFDELLKDLELIRNSEKLKNWRILRRPKYYNYFLNSNFFANIFSDWKIVYPFTLHRIKVNKKEVYWLEIIPLNNRIDKRLFNKDNLFRRIHNDLSRYEKELLLLAYHKQNILPLKKKDAKTLKEIEKKLNEKSKNKTNIISIENAVETIYKDPRNQAIDKTVKKTLKSLEKRLSKYDSKINLYDIQPMFHPEPSE